MDMPVASYAQLKAAGIQEVLCVCTLDTNNVLVACLGTTDLFQLAVDDCSIKVTEIYALDLMTPASKLRYASSIGTVFALSGHVVYSALLSNATTNDVIGIRDLSTARVRDFDIVIVEEGVFVALLGEYEVFVSICSSDGTFPLSQFYVGYNEICSWVTADCLSCSGQGILSFYGVDGTFMHSVGSRNQPAICASPLTECFSCDDIPLKFQTGKNFIVLFERGGAYFSHYLVVYSQLANTISEILEFSIFASLPPKSVFSVGPWVCVSGVFGLEFYDYRTGAYAQSSLETVVTDSCSFATICMDSTLTPSDVLYSKPRYGIAVSKNFICTFCIRSIIDVVDELKDDAAFHADLLQSLLVFGRSVRAKRRMRSYCRRDAVLDSSMLFSEYGSILAKFHIPQSGFPSRKKSLSENMRRSPACIICGSEFVFASNLHPCAMCSLCVCSECSFVRDLRLYGYDSMGMSCVVCVYCDGRCDLNLYRLFLARRYTQLLDYMERYPERCFKLTLTQVIPSVLQQCFQERKYDLCAELLEKYVPKNGALWDQWVLRFGLQKEIQCLARVHNPKDTDQTVSTGILLQLVKCDARVLFSLLQRWPISSYSDQIVLLGIASRLSFKKKEACALQESCQIGKLTLWERQNAISSLYFDDEVDQLLRAYLHLCFQNKRYMDAAKGYMEYFIIMLPFPEEKRERSYEMFEGIILRREPVREFPPPDVIDFWDLLTSNGILHEFVRLKDSTGTTVFLTPLLIHYREEFGRYLVDSLHVDLIDDVLQSVVCELRKEQPGKLLHVLDALTKVSPVVTSCYHSLMSELYLEYAPEKLFSFIQHPQVSGLDWKKLARALEKRNMFRELVYIIGKTGNNVEAVRMAIRCMKSVPFALEYIKDHPDDPRLWNLLVSNVIQSPVLIGDILDAVDDFMDIEFLLQSIPEKNRLNVPHIGPRLKRALRSKWCVERVAESSVNSIFEDNFASLGYLKQQMCKAARCKPSSVCGLCGQVILGECVVDGFGVPFHDTCFHCPSVQCPLNTKRIFGQNCKPRRNKDDYSEMDYIEYCTNRALGVTNLLKLLPEGQIHHILSYLSIQERNVCRRVSRGFRKALGSFYMFAKREDDHVRSRYYARLDNTESGSCLQTVHLGKVPLCSP
ncbi:putative vacuolar protein sorting-associated protein 41 [Trypanosoma grayi]|uniref:putative vacuolar protein sorting-associated protein 41 n=1 Tax=Trypanosoma grayi TaxID=71804 RepID=UPI0004F46E94|nr:putative vacuolar protein sorting-associated protein 41 [Trypanosoma grayi]KEG11404.1 putative vacuolar protein sorting-associated protein 41 [Trypanosoma grayi]